MAAPLEDNNLPLLLSYFFSSGVVIYISSGCAITTVNAYKPGECSGVRRILGVCIHSLTEIVCVQIRPGALSVQW